MYLQYAAAPLTRFIHQTIVVTCTLVYNLLSLLFFLQSLTCTLNFLTYFQLSFTHFSLQSLYFLHSLIKLIIFTSSNSYYFTSPNLIEKDLQFPSFSHDSLPASSSVGIQLNLALGSFEYIVCPVFLSSRCFYCCFLYYSLLSGSGVGNGCHFDVSEVYGIEI